MKTYLTIWFDSEGAGPREVVERLPSKVQKYFDYFELCTHCDRVYWHGDHYKKMKLFLDEVLKD